MEEKILSIKILFSPVGTTDPTSRNYDGSIIQAIKKFRPDKIYLFFSHDMKEHENNNHTIKNYLELIKKEYSFDYKFIESQELENEQPQIFDKYYRIFSDHISNILQENQGIEVELYLSISSGTPAMKSTLFLLASSLNVGQFKNLKNISAVQVNSPFTTTFHVSNETAQELYDHNNDKDDPSGSRAYISKTPNISSYLTRRQINKFIETFDYNGALKLANSMEESLSSKVIALLTYGKARRDLAFESFKRTSEAELVSNSLLYPSFTTASLSSKDNKIPRTLYEYLLNLRALAHNGDTLNFIRSLSPALSVLFSDALRITYPELNDDAFYANSSRGFSSFVIPDTLTFYYREKFTELQSKALTSLGSNNNTQVQLTTVGFLHLFVSATNTFEENPTKNKEEILTLLKFLRLIEDSSRNIVAHEIASLPSSKISEQALKSLNYYQAQTDKTKGNPALYKDFSLSNDPTLISPAYIFQKIDKLCHELYATLPKEGAFEAYEKLNMEIKTQLDI